MTGREADILDVIEAAYAVDRGRDAWLQAIAEAARPVLDCGLGTVAYTTDLRQPGRPVSSRPYTASDVFGQEHGEFFLSDDVVDPELREMMHFSSPVVATGSELAGDRWNDTVAVAAPHGLMDFLGINHLDPSGFCLTLGAPLSELRQATSEERECWSRIACHLGAGLRLRDELEREAQAGQAPLSRAEAVVDADYSVVEARGAARDAGCLEELRAAAKAIDRARRDRRRRPAEAIELWLGLVSGRWSVIDHFDTDGKRFFIAQENQPRTAALTPLTLRERQIAFYAGRGYSNKLIAYNLGIPVGSVAAGIRSVLRKVGLASRADLMRLLAVLRATEPGL